MIGIISSIGNSNKNEYRLRLRCTFRITVDNIDYYYTTKLYCRVADKNIQNYNQFYEYVKNNGERNETVTNKNYYEYRSVELEHYDIPFADSSTAWALPDTLTPISVYTTRERSVTSADYGDFGSLNAHCLRGNRNSSNSVSTYNFVLDNNWVFEYV